MDDLTAFTEPEFLATQEHLARYRADGRGYLAVGLGDVLGDKVEDGNGKERGGSGYVLRHKLGFGGFGVVWLGWDLGKERWVAIKIMVKEHPKFEMGEESMLWRLKGEMGQDGKEDLGESYIVEILDWFEERGHKCLVFEVLGPSVEDVLEGLSGERRGEGGRNEVGVLETGVVLRISRELLCAVASLHERGWGHGDISARNILFTVKAIVNLDQEQIFYILGKPEVHDIKRKDRENLRQGLPKNIVKASTWDHWIPEGEDIRIIDFGEAFKQGDEPEVLREPGSLQVPESILGERLDFRVDLWRVGITMYSFVFGELPWMYLGDKMNLVASMIDFMGELPKEWKVKYEELRKKDGIEWEPLEDPKKGKVAATRLERRFKEEPKDDALKELLPVIKGLMQFKPEARISATEALAMVQKIERKYGREHGTEEKVQICGEGL